MNPPCITKALEDQVSVITAIARLTPAAIDAHAVLDSLEFAEKAHVIAWPGEVAINFMGLDKMGELLPVLDALRIKDWKLRPAIDLPDQNCRAYTLERDEMTIVVRGLLKPPSELPIAAATPEVADDIPF